MKSSSVFNLNEEEMEILCRNSVEISFQHGERIIKEGTFTQNIVFIKSGIFKIHLSGPVKEEIMRIDKGPVFAGVSDVFAKPTHSYSVTALSDTTACFIDYAGYQHLIENNGRFAMEVMKILSADIIHHYHFFVDKVQKQLNAKLAGALILFADHIYEKDTIEIPLTRSELGEYIGTSRESVTKVMHDFIEGNIIKVDGKEIKLLNKDLLIKISQAG
ncbi:MAG: Crp/Fnr family transcriptional regulator [Bacteroidota bacterium]